MSSTPMVIEPTRPPGLPPEWGQGVNLIMQVTGIPLTKFGRYSWHITVDGTHLGDRPFRVLKLY